MKANRTHALSAADIAEARRCVRSALRCRRLSGGWIEDNLDDLLSRAAADYAAKLAAGEQIERPLGWIVKCACWRAQDLLRSQGRRPESASVQEACALPDTHTPGPEERMLLREGEERLRVSLARLPELECRLLALVYFEDLSVSEAAQRLGLAKSTATRRHAHALDRLRGLFAEERTLASPASLGLAAWVLALAEGREALGGAAGAQGALRAALGSATHLLGAAAQRLGDLWRRASPLADPAAAAGAGGGGRALGACGLAAASLLCGAATGGVLPALPDANPSLSRAAPRHSASTAAPQLPEASADSAGSAPGRSERAARPRAALQAQRRARRSQERRSGATAAAQPSGAARSVGEFGVEADQGSAAAPAGPVAPAPGASGGAALSGAGAGARAGTGHGGGGGSTGGAEFGM